MNGPPSFENDEPIREYEAGGMICLRLRRNWTRPGVLLQSEHVLELVMVNPTQTTYPAVLGPSVSCANPCCEIRVEVHIDMVLDVLGSRAVAQVSR